MPLSQRQTIRHASTLSPTQTTNTGSSLASLSPAERSRLAMHLSRKRVYDERAARARTIMLYSTGCVGLLFLVGDVCVAGSSVRERACLQSTVPDLSSLVSSLSSHFPILSLFSPLPSPSPVPRFSSPFYRFNYSLIHVFRLICSISVLHNPFSFQYHSVPHNTVQLVPFPLFTALLR